MRIFSYVAIAATCVMGGVSAVNLTETPCGTNGDLLFNNTNAPSLIPCTKINYLCNYPNATRMEFQIFNTTTGPAPDNCFTFYWDIKVSKHISGPLLLPGIVSVGNIEIFGQSPIIDLSSYNTTPSAPARPLNLTSVEFPDLVNVTDGLSIQYADKIERLSVPKLRNVWTGALRLDLSGSEPPAINLSFPSLYDLEFGMELIGNINAIDMPVLNTAWRINVTSTGNLDCDAFANSVVNTTNYLNGNDSTSLADAGVFCNSKKGSVTTYKAQPTSKSGGSRLGARVDLML